MVVTIRWMDGFKKSYRAVGYECAKDNYWVKDTSGNEYWFPKNEIRYLHVEDIPTLTRVTNSPTEQN